MNSSLPTENVKVMLPGGAQFMIESINFGGRQKVGALDALPFSDVSRTVEGIATTLLDGVRKVKAKKATIEFGVEVGIESGRLAALVCKGTGSANLKITLEWDASSGELE